jgi:hypothetical protein
VSCPGMWQPLESGSRNLDLRPFADLSTPCRSEIVESASDTDLFAFRTVVRTGNLPAACADRYWGWATFSAAGTFERAR